MGARHVVCPGGRCSPRRRIATNIIRAVMSPLSISLQFWMEHEMNIELQLATQIFLHQFRRGLRTRLVGLIGDQVNLAGSDFWLHDIDVPSTTSLDLVEALARAHVKCYAYGVYTDEQVPYNEIYIVQPVEITVANLTGRLIPLTQVRLYIVAMPAFQNRRAALAAARADEAVRPAPFE